MAEIEPGTTLIRGARLADPAQRRAEPADILIRDGVIAAVGSAAWRRRRARASSMRPASLVHPGLINAHTHGHGGLARGQGDRWTLELLLAAGPWIGGGRSLQDKKLTTQIVRGRDGAEGLHRRLRPVLRIPAADASRGWTPRPRPMPRSACAPCVAPMVADRTLYEAIPGLHRRAAGALQSGGRQARACARRRTTLAAIGGVLRNWRWNAEDIRAAVAPTIPLHCADAFMCGCADARARVRRRRCTAMSARARCRRWPGVKRYGKTLVAHIDELGLIGPDFTAAHARLARRRRHAASSPARAARVAHNPGSNMRLGNGMFRLRRALDLGVNVGIGTDGANCSDNQNMYEAMRYASMVSKVQAPDPRTGPSAEEVLQRGDGRLAPARSGFDGYRRASRRATRPTSSSSTSTPSNWMPLNWTRQPARPRRGRHGGAPRDDRRRLRRARPEAADPRPGEAGASRRRRRGNGWRR